MTENPNALVLSGGGILGAFQAGAISRILKEKQLAPNGIFGSSAGALNGAFLTHRAGRQKLETGKVDWAQVGDDLIQFWKEKITGPNVLWKARSYDSIGWDICIRGKFRGLLETDGYQGIVRKALEPIDYLKKAPVDYHPGVVNLFSGKIEYPDKSDKNIIDLIIASSALPIAMDSIDIEQEPFVDGGTRDVAPLSLVVEAGYENVVCIVCQSEQLERREFLHRKISLLFSRVMSIVINETVNNDLKTINRYKKLFAKAGLKKEALGKPFDSYAAVETTTLVRPKKELDYDDMEFTRDDIKKMIQEGIEAADEALRPEKEFRSFDEVLDSKVSGGFTIRW